MRFEQLKHASNTIVRKKLYKSGKNWVVMSSLAFVGGLALLGSSQINTVKADVVSGSDTEQQQQVNTDSANTQGSVNDQDVNNGAAKGNDEQNSSESKEPTSTAPVVGKDTETKVTPSHEPVNGIGEISTQSGQDNINDNEPAPSADKSGIVSTSAPISDPTPTTDDVEGDGWRIDSSTHTLHFTSSDTPLSSSQDNRAVWQGSKYQFGDYAITSIIFDSPVTAGESLSGLFQYLSDVTSITGLDKLNTQKTTDFSNMFTACASLTSLNLTGLDTSSGTNFSGMFNACHSLKSIDISGLNTSKGTNFSVMFGSCYSLKDLDLSHIDMSKLDPGDYGGLLGGSPIETLKLSSKDKLIEAASLSETSDGTGWFSNKYKADDGKADALYSSDQLMNLYDGTNGADTTWQVSNLVNFKIKYVDKTDPKITYTDPSTYSAPLGSDYTVDRNLSYYGQIDNSTPLEVNPDSDGIIVYHTDLSPDELIINEHYPNDSKTKTSKFEPQINGKLDDYFKPTGWLIDANKLNNVDMEKSYAIYNNDTTNPRPFSEIKAIYLSNQDNPSATPSLADLIKSDFSSFNVGDNKLVNKNQPLIEYNIYYKKDESTHTGSSHSDSTPSSTITDFNQNVATFGDRPAVQVYNTEGNTIDETVAPDVDWHSDKKMLLNGITYYSLATDKWVKDSDAYIFFANNADVRTYQGDYVQLTDGNNGKILGRELQAGSDWYTDRIAIFDGEKYYRVATSEFVKVPAVYEYKSEPRVVQTNKNTVVYDELGNTVDIHLPFSEYKSDIAININGNTYYRIATNLFVRADNI